MQVASGSTNPLRYRVLVNLVHQWFSEHPLYDSAGQPIMVAPWSFPGRGEVQGHLNRAKRLLERAEKAFTVLPVRGEVAQVPARLEERRSVTEISDGRTSCLVGRKPRDCGRIFDGGDQSPSFCKPFRVLRSAARPPV